MAVLFASPYFTALDSSGTPISGAKAKFFLAGTTTPQEVWADRALTTTRGATVTADSAGRFPDIWVPETISYRVQILDASDVLLEDVDYAIQATATAAATTTAGSEVKNILVNGGFDVWSLGTSFSNVGGAATLSETADGWFVSQVSTAGNSVTRQAGTSGSSRYGFRFGRPNSNTTTGQIRVLQGIETGLVYRYAGKQVTVSFWAYQGANFSGTNLSVTLATGTAEAEALTGVPNGTWTGQVNAISQVQGLTTTATRYQFTATLGANIREIGLMLAYTPSGTAGANDWVQIENLQIEAAGQATEFAARQTALDFLNARVTQPPTAANFASAFGLGTGDSPHFAAVNIGNASDTTITRVSAGVIAVEGGTVPLENRANTFSAAQTFSSTTLRNTTGFWDVNDGTIRVVHGSDATTGLAGSVTNHDYRWITNNVERMRLSTAGVLTIGGNTAYHAGNLPGTNVNWTTAQTFSAASPQIINRTDSGIYHVEMRGAGTTRGYIGADATYGLRAFNGVATECFRIIHSNGNAEFLFNVTVTGTATANGAELGARAFRTPSITTGTPIASDNEGLIFASAGVTVPASVFSARQWFAIYNNTAAGITITQGASLTLRQASSGATGNFTLTARGWVTIVFISATEAVAIGV